MNSATIIIAIILLLPASQQASAEALERKVLAYNPTYEFWFFMPTGRPDHVSDNVEEAYWGSRKTGGVCYTNVWFYCQTGVKIEE
ncbi:uncharacterized protein LOC108031524 [Drosophila biarmipes]|uniref:uncharacterized protein LOC108031524 n=1 Tax=Drosophila biarmipes TaxID=125945 RepID=UPI0007E63043|nr:uncharacterized protein LOC108031524 [Drosophila biarmipes]